MAADAWHKQATAASRTDPARLQAWLRDLLLQHNAQAVDHSNADWLVVPSVGTSTPPSSV